jgi:hypothetical protein
MRGCFKSFRGGFCYSFDCSLRATLRSCLHKAETFGLMGGFCYGVWLFVLPVLPVFVLSVFPASLLSFVEELSEPALFCCCCC